MSGSLLSFLTVLMFADPSFANEAAPPAAAHGGGDKKEEGSLSKERPWVEVENKLGLLRSKRDAHTIAMKKLREERDHLPEGSPAFQEKMKEYLGVYKQWVAVGEDYNKLLGTLKYRYPERVMKTGATKHEAMEHKTVEQVEAELGIDGKLNKSLRKVRGQYGTQGGRQEDAAKAAAAEAAKESDANTRDSLSQEPQIIIRK